MNAIMQTVDYFHKGGLIMYPLLICSIIVVAITVERYLYFKATDSGNSFAESFCELLRQDKWQSALELSKSTAGDNARILSASMDRYAAGRKKNIQGYIESEAGMSIARMRFRLSYLGVIVTMAPLLGLLGTIFGMISSFSVFDLQAGQPTAITAGIGEALIATATGICVAVLALCAHSYFAHRLDTMVTNMEECASKLLEVAADRGDN